MSSIMDEGKNTSEEGFIYTEILLINWYKYNNDSVPLGEQTMISASNQVGKSVLLDAIKYGIYGDTHFNASADNSKRTILSYVRGLLNEEKGTYLRPAQVSPNVFSHIIVQVYNKGTGRNILLGTVIQADPGDNCVTHRYIIRDMTIREIRGQMLKEDHTPLTPDDIQKIYGVEMYDAQEGLRNQFKEVDLRIDMKQKYHQFLAMQHRIDQYKPASNLSEFIQTNVLEAKNVDMNKIYSRKKAVEDLEDQYQWIMSELSAIKQIEESFSDVQKDEYTLKEDEIVKLNLAKLNHIQELEGYESDLAHEKKTKDDAERRLDRKEEEIEQEIQKYQKANNDLLQVGDTAMIRSLQDDIKGLDYNIVDKNNRTKELQELQDSLKILYRAGIKETELSDPEVLNDLVGEFSFADRSRAVETLLNLVKSKEDKARQERSDAQIKALDQSKKVRELFKIVEGYEKNTNPFYYIQENVLLRDEINKEFAKQGMDCNAKLACEYVTSIKNEEWRDAIEGFLNHKRYTVLVDPEGYYVANDVFERLNPKMARLFKTRRLMKAETKVVENSVLEELEIMPNPVAQKYFEFQLGRIQKADKETIKDLDNALTAYGRASVGMEDYFVTRKEKLKAYYLGRESLKKNRERAEKEYLEAKRIGDELDSDFKKKKDAAEKLSDWLSIYNKSYDFDAPNALRHYLAKKDNLIRQKEELEKKMEQDEKFQKLHQLMRECEENIETYKKECREIRGEIAGIDGKISSANTGITRAKEALDADERNILEKQAEDPILYADVMIRYEQRLKENQKISVLSRSDLDTLRTRLENERGYLNLIKGQYIAKYRSSSGDIDLDSTYFQNRHYRLQSDDYERTKARLNDAKKEYEDDFKKEFVSKIYRYCDDTMKSIRKLNRTLHSLQYEDKYKLDAKYKTDGTTFAKIMAYAQSVEESAKMDLGIEGQMTISGIGQTFEDEERLRLAEDVKLIVNEVLTAKDNTKIKELSDYRNYMTYTLYKHNAHDGQINLSKQLNKESGSGVQIPYLLILLCGMMNFYEKRDCPKLIYMDEAFKNMDSAHIKTFMRFIREQGFQSIYVAPDKIDSIGEESDMILYLVKDTAPDGREFTVVGQAKKKKIGEPAE